MTVGRDGPLRRPPVHEPEWTGRHRMEPHRQRPGRPSRPGVPLDQAEITDVSVAAMVAYWQGIHPASGDLPGRRHLDPISIPKLLANTWLIDVRRDPLRFRCRLFGTAMVTATGLDLTGRYLDDPRVGFAGSAAEVDFTAIAADGVARWWRGPASLTTVRHLVGLEVVMLPLAEDGKTVDVILNYTKFLVNLDMVP